MIRMKMLGLFSLLVIWSNPIQTLKQAADQCINGLHKESQTSLEEYRKQVDSMSPDEIIEHNREIFAEKDHEIQRLKKYLQSIQSKWSKGLYYLIIQLIEAWEKSTEIIELPSKIGPKPFTILMLAHSNPDEAFEQFKEEFLTPANLEHSLIASEAKNPDNLEEFLSIFDLSQEALVKKFDEAMMDQDFKQNLENCAEIVRASPDLLIKFNNTLSYCKRHCTFDGSRVTIHRLI